MPLGVEVNLVPGDFVFDGDPARPEKRAHPPPRNFWPMSIVAKRLVDEDATSMEVDLGADHMVLDGVPGPRERGTAAPLFSAHVYCGHGRPSQLLLSSC